MLFAHNTSSNMITVWDESISLWDPYQVWCQGVSNFNGHHRCLIKSCNRAQAGIGSIHRGIYRPSSVRTDVPVEILYSEQRRRKAAACLCRQRAWWELLVALWCPLSREESRNRYSLLMVWSAAGSYVLVWGQGYTPTYIDIKNTYFIFSLHFPIITELLVSLLEYERISRLLRCFIMISHMPCN